MSFIELQNISGWMGLERPRGPILHGKESTVQLCVESHQQWGLYHIHGEQWNNDQLLSQKKIISDMDMKLVPVQLVMVAPCLLHVLPLCSCPFDTCSTVMKSPGKKIKNSFRVFPHRACASAVWPTLWLSFGLYLVCPHNFQIVGTTAALYIPGVAWQILSRMGWFDLCSF